MRPHPFLLTSARCCDDAGPTAGVGRAWVPSGKGARIGRPGNGTVGEQHVPKALAADTDYASRCAPSSPAPAGPPIAVTLRRRLSLSANQPVRSAVKMPSETPRTISPEAENGLAVNVLLPGMVGDPHRRFFPHFAPCERWFLRVLRGFGVTDAALPVRIIEGPKGEARYRIARARTAGF